MFNVSGEQQRIGRCQFCGNDITIIQEVWSAMELLAKNMDHPSTMHGQ